MELNNAQKKAAYKLQKSAQNAMRAWGEYHSNGTGHTIEFNRTPNDFSIRCVQCSVSES